MAWNYHAIPPSDSGPATHEGGLTAQSFDSSAGTDPNHHDQPLFPIAPALFPYPPDANWSSPLPNDYPYHSLSGASDMTIAPQTSTTTGFAPEYFYQSPSYHPPLSYPTEDPNRPLLHYTANQVTYINSQIHYSVPDNAAWPTQPEFHYNTSPSSADGDNALSFMPSDMPAFYSASQHLSSTVSTAFPPFPSLPPEHVSPASQLQFDGPKLGKWAQPLHLAPSAPHPTQVAVAEQDAPKLEAKKAKKRQTVEVRVTCCTCQKPFARLIKRGTEADLAPAHAFRFTCSSCLNSNDGALDDLAINAAVCVDFPKRPGKSHSDPRASSVPPASYKGKRGRGHNDSNASAKCDVCHRVIGQGGCTMSDPDVEQYFTIEIICQPCDDKYKRCTDCGAGGGKRVGVGKWRAKELFEDGRKTCGLLHFRPSSFTEVEIIVCKTADIPRNQLPQLGEFCRKLVEQNYLATKAIPETMESSGAYLFPTSTYEDILKASADSWRHMSMFLNPEPFIPTAVRYVSVKWCRPQPRKSTPSSQQTNSLSINEPRTTIMRPGKEFVAFGLFEYDTARGVLFVPMVVPFTNSEGFESSLDLIEETLDVISDQAAEGIQRLRDAGEIERAKNTPGLTHIFTMPPYTKETRVRNYMEKKASFMPLEKYLKKYPDASPELFPPLRPSHLPEQALLAFPVLVKRYDPQRDTRRTKAR